MIEHASFQALAGPNKVYWEVAVVWAHLLREKILDLKFQSEAEAEFWIEQYSDQWLFHQRKDAPSGKMVMVTAREEEKTKNTIFIVSEKRGLSAADLVASHFSGPAHVRIVGPAPLSLLERLDVAPGQIKLISGMSFIDRARSS
jgi:hypothetical protein